MDTEDGFPEVYLLLREYVNSQGHAWVQVRIPARPNGQIGWVRRSALARIGVSHWLLVVDRRAERLTAYHDGRRVFVAPVGVGKPSTPTPPGYFWIRERFRVPDPSSPYFPYAMGTSDYSTLSEWPGGGVVGIHGAWGQPWLIPGDPSHGCIRMHNGDIAWLAPRVPVGTPLHVI
jgi:lipoprotein-anchoring transpeptidase ErfK/SrfK